MSLVPTCLKLLCDTQLNCFLSRHTMDNVVNLKRPSFFSGNDCYTPENNSIEEETSSNGRHNDDCPIAFHKIGNKCYFYGYFKLNWFRAMEFCHSFGESVSLACIESHEENNHLKDWLIANGKRLHSKIAMSSWQIMRIKPRQRLEVTLMDRFLSIIYSLGFIQFVIWKCVFFKKFLIFC